MQASGRTSIIDQGVDQPPFLTNSCSRLKRRLATVFAARIRKMDFLKQTILLAAERDFQASERPAAKKISDPDGQVFS